MGPFVGVKLIPHPGLVEFKVEEVRRSWPERLLEMPWQPWRATRLVQSMVPSRKVMRVGDDLYAHPEMIEQISRQLNAREAA